CCASADEQSAKSIALSARTVIFLFMCFFSASSTCHSTLDTCLFSLDHLIRTRQHVGGNRQADLLRSLQIDDELKFDRLLHVEICGLGAFQTFIQLRSGAPVQVGHAHAVKHEPPVFYKLPLVVYRREPVLYREVCNFWSLRKEDAAR